VPAEHRCAHPGLPGIPWWGAVLLAATFTAIGFAFDAGSGNKQLSFVFAAAYFIGCVAAVLAVRQNGIFTAVIQPPLILFVSVPAAYFLFTSGQSAGLKDVLINCAYPLIERFPLMFFTSAAALLIGMGRWYHGMSTRKIAPKSTSGDAPNTSVGATVTSKFSSLLGRRPGGDEDVEDDEPPRRRRSADTAARKPAKRPPPTRSRHTRPPETDIIGPVADRPRRTRASGRQAEQPPAEPRRRPRAASTQRRSVPPPSERRPERRRRPDDFQPREPHGTNGNGTHHPISHVRYRGESDDGPEPRPRRRTPRDRDVEDWEYDI
jgi:fumarate reductase subunit D